MTRPIAAFFLLLAATAAQAQDIPPCARTGSMTMMIGGRPALRLSDVAKCPPELYDVIRSVMIDGQPMVHFRSGIAGRTRCAAKGDPTVTAEGKHAQALGDVSCETE